MEYAIQFLCFLATAFGYSVLIWPVLKIARSSLVAQTMLATAVLFTPLSIDANQVGLRALACVIVIELWFKILDYSRCLGDGEVTPETFGRFAAFLVPFPTLLVRYQHRTKAGEPLAGGPRLILSGVVFGLLFLSGFGLVNLCSQIEAVRSSFLLDHALKLAIFVLTIESLSRVLLATEHLAGFGTTPLIQNAFLSRTVGEFWIRYNTRVHAWFDANVFRRFGGRRHPVRGVLLTFFISGLFHELMFGIATSRFDGYQFAFFMIQAPAILCSRALHRFASANGLVGTVADRTVTILWMAATSVLFFHGVDRVFPFYYAATPILP